MKKENLMVLDEDQKVHLAINRLGLATLSPFNPKCVQLLNYKTITKTLFNIF